MKASVLSYDTIPDCMFLFVTGNLVTDSGLKTLPSKMFRCVNWEHSVRCVVLWCSHTSCAWHPWCYLPRWARSLPWKLSARVSLYSVLRWSHVSNVTHCFLSECRVNYQTVRCRVSRPHAHEAWKYFQHLYSCHRYVQTRTHVHTHTMQYTERKPRIEPFLCCCLFRKSIQFQQPQVFIQSPVSLPYNSDAYCREL